MSVFHRCDICGADIGLGLNTLKLFYEGGGLFAEFCETCRISFNEWKGKRRKP